MTFQRSSKRAGPFRIELVLPKITGLSLARNLLCYQTRCMEIGKMQSTITTSNLLKKNGLQNAQMHLFLRIQMQRVATEWQSRPVEIRSVFVPLIRSDAGQQIRLLV